MTRFGVAVVCVVGVLLAGAGPAGAVLPAGNLLANSGAEDGAAGAGGGQVSSIPGWTTRYNPMGTVVAYGTPGGFPTSSSPSAAGTQFFAGGPSALASPGPPSSPNLTRIVQTVAVGGPEIASGTVQAVFTGCLGGFATQNDLAELVLQYTAPTGGGTMTGVLGSQAGPDASGRANKTVLLPATVHAAVPANATSLSANVDFSRTSGAGTYDDGYADNLRLTLILAGTPLTPPLACPTPTTTTSTGDEGTGVGPGTHGTTPPTSSTGTNPGAGISRGSKRLTLKGRYAQISLRCTLHDGTCKGTLSLAATGLPKAHKAIAAKKKAKATKLGSAKFTIPAGKTKTVKVKVKRSIRKRLGKLSKKRLKKLKITATAKLGTKSTKFALVAVRKH